MVNTFPPPTADQTAATSSYYYSPQEAYTMPSVLENIPSINADVAAKPPAEAPAAPPPPSDANTNVVAAVGGDANDGTIDDASSEAATESSSEEEEPPILLGGKQPSPSFALLTGVWTDPSSDDDTSTTKEQVVVNVPLLRLPAILGRKHKTEDDNFVALPKEEPLLSRLHCSIVYRDDKGGKLVQEGSDGLFTFVPLETNQDDDEKDQVDPNNVLRLPEMDKDAPLPKSGFYAIECLGRHKIRVGGKLVKRGQQAMLKDGMTVQIASYCFYFMLPKIVKKKPKVSVSPAKSAGTNSPVKEKKTAKPKQPKEAVGVAPIVAAAAGGEAGKEAAEDTPKPTAVKREASDTGDATTTSPKAPPKKKRKSSDTPNLDTLSNKELLTLLANAISCNEWDFFTQKIGAALGVGIIREAAKDPAVQKVAREEHGVTQRYLMEWTSRHAIYHDYEKLMCSKIEKKSFMTKVGKAILKAGYTKNETNPGKTKASRWDLPSDIPMEPVSPRRAPVKSPVEKMEAISVGDAGKVDAAAKGGTMDKVEVVAKMGSQEGKEESGGDVLKAPPVPAVDQLMNATTTTTQFAPTIPAPLTTSSYLQYLASIQAKAPAPVAPTASAAEKPASAMKEDVTMQVANVPLSVLENSFVSPLDSSPKPHVSG